jgi:hypothetical protein
MKVKVRSSDGITSRPIVGYERQVASVERFIDPACS